MLQKKLTQIFKNLLPIFSIAIFAFLVNYHYGFIGLMPMDNTVLYNGGYRILNGYIPFTDYWLVTGPLLDYLNALFFYLLGTSWQTFIIHSSIFNALLGVTSYFLFNELGLSKKFSTLYSILISLLFYPVVGTPFVDHHSTFFMIMAFYSFIFSINKKDYFYILFVPIFFCFSFLSKQTPAAYGLLTITILIVLTCFFDKERFKSIFYNLFLGTIISFVFLVLFFLFTKINLTNFINQYIIYAGSIGEYRFINYEFKILDIIENYKFIYFFILILIIISFFMIKNFTIKKKDILVILTSLLMSCLLIFHQFLTLNQNFIFFLIPFLCAISHIFYEKNYKNKIITTCLIFVCLTAVFKYHFRFNEERKFNELSNVDISKAINAEVLSKQLKGLKWITYKYPKDPNQEIQNLKEIIEILKNDETKKILITDYQFLPAIIGIYDFSPNQWHHPTVSFPLKENIYFEDYKKFFVNNINKNKIEFIFETIEKDKTITELIINSDCFKKERIGKMLIKIRLIKNCEDLS